jgi:hypothetical protein
MFSERFTIPPSISWRSSSSGARYSSQRRPPVTPQCGEEPRIPPLRAVVADRDAQCLLLPGSIPGRFLIKLSRLRVARRIPHSATCFVTPWQPAIRSRRTWRREMPLHFRKYSHSCLNSSRLRSIDEERHEKPALCWRITQAWLRFGYRTWGCAVEPILVPITSPDTINSTRRFC